MNLIVGIFYRWLGIVAIVVVLMVSLYYFNAFRAESGRAAQEPQPSLSSSPSRSETTATHYAELSQAAEYVVYGRVSSELDQTRGVFTPDPNNTSLTVPVIYRNFVIGVIQSADAQGHKDNQLPLGDRITIRQASTTASPRFTPGEVFLAFLKGDPKTGTYFVVSLPATLSRDLTPIEGKLPVTIKDNQAYVSSSVTVSNLLRAVEAPGRSQ